MNQNPDANLTAEPSRLAPLPAGFLITLAKPSGQANVDRILLRFDDEGRCDIGLYRKTGASFKKAMGIQQFWPEDIASEIKIATGLELRPSELKELDDMRIGSIIIGQYGGKGFMVMTGTHDRCKPIDSGISILLADDMPGCDMIAKIETKLTPMDDYTASYFRKTGKEWELVAESKHLYFDDLQSDFRDKTGLETRLPIVFVCPTASQEFQAWN